MLNHPVSGWNSEFRNAISRQRHVGTESDGMFGKSFWVEQFS